MKITCFHQGNIIAKTTTVVVIVAVVAVSFDSFDSSFRVFTLSLTIEHITIFFFVVLAHELFCWVE